MNLEEFKRVGTAIQAILNEINSNPSKFALEILQMHIDVVKKRDQYKAERDSLIRDIEKLRNKLEGAETYIDAIKTYKPMYEKLRERNKELERENERLLIQSNYYARHNELAQERLRQLLPMEHNYMVLTSHIRQKAEANPGVSRYIDLVNYIDRLESIDNER
ncbi:hypothetical protein QI283_03255 [Staphylococcus saprophyticus]|uniref:hypothetical protein n=1 Tax=Staphylococcus saprophyticus TaxID=29385 RepID=UPI0010112AC5|nr:hypothetical protein [Staphylococcus saprophyticus]MDW3939137.1 hypothetical protein [Staphylococcus saprophyticus]MDW4212568.1 hypothetical protein [Staphylococcus saprophyticus]MDW4227546.1 hypothetical protein [Staphylococcus saprophyticus]MDW4281713.1 hypothetical protein [Staphylococcus saprophyticus]MDW4362583.1 hypothetical protein [Staphylococcus saprophyticus]